MQQSSATDYLRRSHIVIMAICTGLIVANIYYCQPLLVLISKSFGISESKGGRIAFLTQLGYALGLLFFVPLGDKVERRGQIVWMAAFAVLSLVFAAVSPNLLCLEIASVCIGATSVIPQLILPLAAHLAQPSRTGKVIGAIMSGLLIGILLSRTLSGFVGRWLGWRGMFWVASVISFSLLIIIRYSFPPSRPNFTGSYASLMRSLVTLAREQPVLREAAAINALGFATFGMFWTTMVLHLSGAPFHFKSDLIGLFGLAAAAGALAAPLVGGSADKRNPRIAIGYGLCLLLLSFVLLYVWADYVSGMVAGIVLLDLAMQCIHVSNQSRVYALIPHARNRLNTVYMTVSFIGTSLGSAVGLFAWDKAGWTGVCITGALLTTAAFTIYALTFRKIRPATA
ncbi:MFS transporter [Puia dinghuensis]|uniref:MFS transporter n=1 Tax=Puia dinghuensis TaxID=1792502 RepID=A0A8J2UFH9_9BACT|nr:MFS transporter [Puia dinghuensis]GGB09995.1 MFS transporter [Puia dinghuensis]